MERDPAVWRDLSFQYAACAGGVDRLGYSTSQAAFPGTDADVLLAGCSAVVGVGLYGQCQPHQYHLHPPDLPDGERAGFYLQTVTVYGGHPCPALPAVVWIVQPGLLHDLCPADRGYLL